MIHNFSNSNTDWKFIGFEHSYSINTIAFPLVILTIPYWKCNNVMCWKSGCMIFFILFSIQYILEKCTWIKIGLPPWYVSTWSSHTPPEISFLPRTRICPPCQQFWEEKNLREFSSPYSKESFSIFYVYK